MATYTFSQLKGAGTPSEGLTGTKTFTLTNPSSGSAYFTVETVEKQRVINTTNALGTYANFVGIDVNSLVTSSYVSSVVVPSGVSSYQFTPNIVVASKSSMLRATGGISLVIS